MHICVSVAEWQHLALNLISHLEILQRRNSSPWPAEKRLPVGLRGKAVPSPLHVRSTLCCVCSYRHTQFIIIEDLENGQRVGGLFLKLEKTEITFQAVHEGTPTTDTPEDLWEYLQFWAVSRKEVEQVTGFPLHTVKAPSWFYNVQLNFVTNKTSDFVRKTAVVSHEGDCFKAGKSSLSIKCLHPIFRVTYSLLHILPYYVLQ